MFTLPAQRQLPNLVIASPKDEQELRSLLRTALRPGPPVRAALPARRRASGCAPVDAGGRSRSGAARSCARAATCCSSASGRSWRGRVEVADALAAEGWSVGVINARFAKPLDRQLILDQARGKRLVVTLEESVVTGGFGSGVLELLEEARLADPAYRDVAVRIVGIPGDRFVDHGSVADLRRVLRLDAAGPRRPGPRDARDAPGDARAAPRCAAG